RSVRLAVSGASPLPAEVGQAMEDRFGVPLWEGYGLTEAAPIVTSSLMLGRPRPGAIGGPLPGVELRLVDSNGQETLLGDAGEIWVRGPNVFPGYWNDPAATARVLTPDGWLRTGDVAVADEEGYLHIVDRAKDLIIVLGFNVFPAEVEETLMTHPVIADGRPRRIPEATVARLPVYWRALLELAEARTPTVSSDGLAEMAGENAAKVRKDLSYLGSYGTRGAGYDVQLLTAQIGHELGLNEDWPVVIVGVGNLGRALANYRGFSSRGFRVATLVDADPAKVGQMIGGLVVSPVDDLPALVEREQLAIGLIATPASAAQGVADRLVAAGITSLL